MHYRLSTKGGDKSTVHHPRVPSFASPLAYSLLLSFVWSSLSFSLSPSCALHARTCVSPSRDLFLVFCCVLLFVAFLFHFFVHFCPSMAPKFDALRSGVPHREAYRLLVRIDRLWVVLGFINPDEAMAIEMVFLDQHV
ncbi:hypothetical protein RIF29_21567 [Crotalaria pallida]|uniref:Uncharacterized protein n=1 Tax=Crotalaria pallida TaxID=3830 RepID=A0AAN9F7K6_CROPI